MRGPERCDEIVRLIDLALAEVGDTGATVATPPGEGGAGVRLPELRPSSRPAQNPPVAWPPQGPVRVAGFG